MASLAGLMVECTMRHWLGGLYWGPGGGLGLGINMAGLPPLHKAMRASLGSFPTEALLLFVAHSWHMLSEYYLHRGEV